MPRYKVELLSVSRDDESKDVQFITYVEASNTDDAVRKAKDVQKKEKPEVHAADNWFWFAYETAEKPATD